MIGNEGKLLCYRKGRRRHRIGKRGGSAGKEWEIVKDDFLSLGRAPRAKVIL